MRPDTRFDVPGLAAPVEVLVDEWGIPHIYARSRDDLFVAQGFNAARDRLFQLDLWRRRGLGLLAEVCGPAYVAHDRAARLFLYRGDMRAEWLAYGSDTKQVTTAFVRGVNAFVALCRRDPAYLPPEFALLDYLPAFWGPEDVARIRSHGIHRNLEQEVARALTLRDFDAGVEELRKTREPDAPIAVPDGLDLSLLPDDVLDVYRLATAPLRLDAPSLVPAPTSAADGSNNWVLAPERTATGRPLLANDPHRAVGLPSLRYVAHLSAPGIDVIGAGEPVLPGVSIGHNGHIAFGLTIFTIDQEDLYVYRLDPSDPGSYRYQDRYEPMTMRTEEIPVRGGQAERVELAFTRHGPVIWSDRDTAFAVRAAWLEPGMAPYLGSMDYMRARTADDFVDAMNRWGSPGENQVYATPDGTIGWQPAGLVPIRPNWDGMLPVPGDGRYEWAGFYDADQLPSVRNPEAGWFATANQMNLPDAHPSRTRGIGYEWSAPYRYERIAERLAARTDWTVADCVELQCDYVSLPARELVRHLTDLRADDPEAAAGLELLRGWDADMGADSPAAALFETWLRRHLRPKLYAAVLGPRLSSKAGTRALRLIIPPEEYSRDLRVDLDLLAHPDGRLGETPDETVRSVLLSSLAGAVREVRGRLGDDPSGWAWGQLHQARPRHPLADALGDRAPSWMTVGPAPRGGSADTVGCTAYLPMAGQVHGATFRIVVDVGSWDSSVVINTPGQSGVPVSPHYADLFETWAADRAVPLLYGRDLVEQHVDQRIELRPAATA